MPEQLPWWRKVDSDLIMPYRILRFGLDTWQATLARDFSNAAAFRHVHTIDIWRTRHWLFELGPRLDEVLHEFAAVAQGIARHGELWSAASMHGLAYRLLNRWIRHVERTVMLNKHGATRTLDFEGGPYEDTPENLTAATLESIWDDEMRISSPRDIFDRGRVELAWEDIRDCFAAIVEASSGADYRPTRGHFSDIDLALQQEVCRAYASRNAMRGGPSEKTVASQATATMLPSRKQLKGSPLLVLEVIANAPTRLTCQQIIDTLKQQTTPLSESAVKKALQNLTMLGYVDNRQDISPPGYAAVGVHPGVHSKA